MRKYKVYKQTAKLLYVCTNWSSWRYLPYEYICTVSGTKKLCNLFLPKLNKKIEFRNTFLYSDEWVHMSEVGFGILEYNEPPDRYVIVDDKGRIRDYYELVDRYLFFGRNTTRRVNSPIGCKIYGNKEERMGMLPDDVRYIKDEYGISILSPRRKRVSKFCDEYKGRQCHRSWKYQSKKRRQYQ